MSDCETSPQISRKDFLKTAAITTAASVVALSGCNKQKDPEVSIPVSSMDYPIVLKNTYHEEDPNGDYEYLWKHVPPEVHFPIEILQDLGEDNVIELSEYIKGYFEEFGFVRNISQYGSRNFQVCNIVDKDLSKTTTTMGGSPVGLYVKRFDESGKLIDEIQMDFKNFYKTYAAAGDKKMWDMKWLSASLIHEIIHSNKRLRFHQKRLKQSFTVPGLGEITAKLGFNLFVDANENPSIPEFKKCLDSIEEAAVSFISVDYLRDRGWDDAWLYSGYLDLFNIMNAMNDEGWFETLELSDALQRSDLDWFVRMVRGVNDISTLDYVAVTCWFAAARDKSLPAEEIFNQMSKYRGKALGEDNFKKITDHFPSIDANDLRAVLVSSQRGLVVDC